MNLTVIVVYNRLDNLKHWLECWKQCEQHSQLVIIHTGEETVTVPENVIYIKRKNIGFDIGTFQDVCLERLPGFPNDWDKMLWITDDTLPMRKDFDKVFFDALDNKTVGCACMEISPSVRRHIRTTGFAITKEVSKKLTFLVDPIVTKEDCYNFEHRSQHILYNQIIAQKLQVVQVATAQYSPLWDTGYKKALNRANEHAAMFPNKTNPKISIICPVYKNYPVVAASMIAQTYQNWELILVHDGPDVDNVKQHVSKDKRITFEETEKHLGNWGHYIRRDWINKVDGDFIVITNADNYHMPTYLEEMLKGFTPNTVATYCSQMVHSYIQHKIINCRIERGYVDCAGVMLRANAAKQVGWQDVENHSSDWTFFEAIAKRYGIANFVKVEGCLLVHN